jgi:hypothetical protein
MYVFAFFEIAEKFICRLYLKCKRVWYRRVEKRVQLHAISLSLNGVNEKDIMHITYINAILIMSKFDGIKTT